MLVIDGRCPTLRNDVSDLLVDLVLRHLGQKPKGFERSGGLKVTNVVNTCHGHFLISIRFRVRFCADVALGDVQLVHGVELELDLFPRLHGDGKFRAVLGSLCKDVTSLFLDLAAFVTRLDGCF